MQHKKKLLTTLTLTILTLSIVLATIPMASAIGVPTLDKSTGPVGTKVLVSGSDATKWGLVEIYWNTPAAENKLNQTYANSAGGFSCYITVPPDYADGHFVIAKDVESGLAEGVEFTITSKIVLKPDKGLPGDLVTVTGTGFAKSVKVGIGFGAEVPVTAETVTLTGTQPGPLTGTLANRPVKPGTPGITITCGVTVTADEGTGSGTVSVTDDGAGVLTGTTTFLLDDLVTSVTVDISGTINYATGAISLTASVTGGTNPTVTIDSATADYTHYTSDVTPLAGITTNATGSFEASIKIPAIDEIYYGDYDVTAVDAEGNSATDIITVNYYITVKPEKGPPGITVDVSGRVESAKSVEVKFGRATTFVTAFVTTSDADGYFSGEYTLPTLLEPTNYEFTAIWDTKERTTLFEVLPAPTITLEPDSEAVGETVTVTGKDFSSKANVTIYFDTTVVNETKTDTAGGFECTFVVPTVATGTYKVKAVDQYGASAEAYFTVVPPPALVVQPRATEYLQGDTISFSISSTLKFYADTINIAIVDPDGYPFWTVTWTLEKIDTVWSVPYEDQVDDVNKLHLTLPSDAPLGSWNWTATYTITTLKKATGLFTVVERPTLSELDAKIVDLDEDVVTLSTKVGTVKTSVDSIGLTVTSIEDDVATIETDLGTLQGTVTSIDGNVATIETDVGTVKADVSGLVEDVADIAEIGVTVDLTPVWIAVALSLIAAIAACYGVVALHRKIA